jgi:hypothetical protein
MFEFDQREFFVMFAIFVAFVTRSGSSPTHWNAHLELPVYGRAAAQSS